MGCHCSISRCGFSITCSQCLYSLSTFTQYPRCTVPNETSRILPRCLTLNMSVICGSLSECMSNTNASLKFGVRLHRHEGLRIAAGSRLCKSKGRLPGWAPISFSLLCLVPARSRHLQFSAASQTGTVQPNGQLPTQKVYVLQDPNLLHPGDVRGADKLQRSLQAGHQPHQWPKLIHITFHCWQGIDCCLPYLSHSLPAILHCSMPMKSRDIRLARNSSSWLWYFAELFGWTGMQR